MADYYTEFSLTLPLRTDAEKAWVNERIAGGVIALTPHTADDADSVGPDDQLYFDATIQQAEEDAPAGVLWIYSQDSGNVDDVIVFLQAFLKAHRDSSEHISFEWSHSCSKPRTDAFGGGATIITADRAYWTNTGAWLEKKWAWLSKRLVKQAGKAKAT
ncbi:MAG: hypothetical protein HQ559_10795 [Lentisphaerae bacterium]|nr:hypothetical protein [Lentisphaerota bacterium]